MSNQFQKAHAPNSPRHNASRAESTLFKSNKCVYFNISERVIKFASTRTSDIFFNFLGYLRIDGRLKASQHAGIITTKTTNFIIERNNFIYTAAAATVPISCRISFFSYSSRIAFNRKRVVIKIKQIEVK